MKNVDKNKLKYIALANTVILFAYAFAVSGIYYETNDDATLSNILNGAFGGNGYDLIYVNIWLSRFMKILQDIFTGSNMVVVVQLVFVFLSIWRIITLIMEKYNAVQGLIMANILFLPFATELISKFQYVKTSTVIIIAGLMLIAVNLAKTNIRLFTGYLLVVVGCGIRFDSFLAAGALSAFTLLYYFFRLDSNGKMAAIKKMVVLFVIVFGLEGINRVYYSTNPAWKDFTEYNRARTKLSDYKENYIPLYFDNVVARGFSENDVQLMYNGNYFDNTYFTTDVIYRAADAVGNKPVKNIIADYLHIVINLFHPLNEKIYKLGFILCLLLFVFSDKKSKLYQFGTLAMFALLILYLMTVNRFMSRIEAMLIIALAINCVMCFDTGVIEKFQLIKIVHITMVVIILLCMPVQLRYRKGKYNAYLATGHKYENIILEMSNSKENLYLFDSSQTDYFAGYDVFSPRPAGFFSNICPTGSWYSNSLYSNSVLDAYNMESPLIDSVNNPNVFISNERLDIKLKYVQEHYDQAVYAVKVTDNGICDYQFRKD